jgi:hypothetical protein
VYRSIGTWLSALTFNPATSDAIEALETAQGRDRVLEIKFKAQSMAELAKHVCGPALTAEANMIARLANERLTAMPEGEVRDRRIDLEHRVSRSF